MQESGGSAESSSADPSAATRPHRSARYAAFPLILSLSFSPSFSFITISGIVVCVIFICFSCATMFSQLAVCD